MAERRLLDEVDASIREKDAKVWASAAPDDSEKGGASRVVMHSVSKA